MTATVVFEGITELNRSLAASGPAVVTAMRTGMREAAKPVSTRAEELANTEISGMARKKTSDWAVTRIGIRQDSVYIVPKERGVRRADDPKARPFHLTKSGGPPFGVSMLDKAYNPAQEAGADVVEANVLRLVGEVTRAI